MTKKPTKLRTAFAVAFVGAMLLALLPAGAASAHGPGTVTTAGTAQLSGGVGVPSGTGTASGTAVGTHGTSPALGTFSADFSYSNPNTVEGTADGTVTLSGGVNATCGFHWERTGLVALVSLFNCTGHSGISSGSAVCAFVPLGVAGEFAFSCEAQFGAI